MRRVEQREILGFLRNGPPTWPRWRGEAVSAVSHIGSQSLATHGIPRSAGVRSVHLVSMVEQLEPNSTG
jgi:hypothetical protein